jgi:uncharacterized protein (TIGR03435 family)
MRHRRIAISVAMAAAVAAAQDVPSPAQFEVAAIKLSSGHPSGMFPKPGRLTVGNRTLKQMITEVYRLMGYQVMGASGWMDSIAYEIEAKATGPAKFNEMVEMLKPLMAGRFQLAFHWETKEMPIYWLVAAKNGPKIRKPDASDTSPGFLRNRPHYIEGHKMGVAQLVYFLGGELQVPLVDKTGLEGDYEFKLEWSDDTRPVADGGVGGADLEKPSLFAAVQEQLGLKLETHPGPVKIFVIDHAEKPALDQ